ncbi:unnamed protein product, partial [Discosporangium mesarthrocarpum]
DRANLRKIGIGGEERRPLEICIRVVDLLGLAVEGFHAHLPDGQVITIARACLRLRLGHVARNREDARPVVVRITGLHVKLPGGNDKGEGVNHVKRREKGSGKKPRVSGALLWLTRVVTIELVDLTVEAPFRLETGNPRTRTAVGIERAGGVLGAGERTEVEELHSGCGIVWVALAAELLFSHDSPFQKIKVSKTHSTV